MNQVNTMNWLNALSGNFSIYMKNFVANAPFFGIAINGQMFVLYPECNAVATMSGANVGGIQVACYDIENVSINTLQQNWYKAPIAGYPAYIEEANCVLFASAEERDARIKAYGGSAVKTVKAYASGMACVINASYTAVTVLNNDEQFYCLNNGSKTRLPSANDDQKDDIIKKYQLSPAVLDVNYVLVINSVIRNTRISEGDSNEVTVSSDIKIIPKNRVIKGEPLIQDTTGMVIFNSSESVDEFINKYGSMTKYLVTKALKATKDQYERDLKDVNEQASQDKNAMMNVYMMLGGTSILSVATEEIIRSAQTSSDDTTVVKKTLLACGLVAGVIATGVGLYSIAKKLKIFGSKKVAEITGNNQ